MSKAVLTLEVSGSKLEVFDDRVRISPVGFLGFFSKGFSGPKEIFYKGMTAVQFREAGVVQGFIQFTVMGAPEYSGSFGAMHTDENTVVFGGALGGGDQHNARASEIRDFVTRRISESMSNGSKVTNEGVSGDLEKLFSMKERGILSEEEFLAAKKKILSL